MTDLCSITTVGRLGQDVSITTTEKGTKIAKFTIARNKHFKDGNRISSRTTWFKVTAFGYKADYCEEKLYKGQKILVSGELDIRTYSTPQSDVDSKKDGVSYEIILSDNPVLFETKDKKNNGQLSFNNNQTDNLKDDFEDLDIPF